MSGHIQYSLLLLSIFLKVKDLLTLNLNFFFRDFYIFGESYGGKYVPSLSHRIHKSKIDPDNFGGAVDINLVGLGEFKVTIVQALKSKKLKINPKLQTFLASSIDSISSFQ